ncbi:hypothetical protein LG52_2620 [Geobacillus kaustophilus]|uniref:Uncharacterized protein n=1 Tax=Geobacillus kaustophilus TaxID=1462 RepID=A0A0D8BX41_GEOKU|nr:hypothetical protein [Geobacillus kaustophilus]KJE28756.1 hypothetical protein LG52_2620 [Geobacillus kaustophilus]
MPQQNGRLNTDLDNKLTSSYYDGAKWHMFMKALNADIEALGSTTDPATAQTVIGLLKALIAKLPSALQNDALKSVLTAPIPSGTNKIGSVDIANTPTVRVDSTNPVNINVTSGLPSGNNKIGSVDIVNKPTVLVDSVTPINVNIAQPTALQITKVSPNNMKSVAKSATNANTSELVISLSSVQGRIVEYIITADAANVNPIYIGESDVDGTKGIPLSPGQQFRLEYGKELYFYAQNTTDKIRVTIISAT